MKRICIYLTYDKEGIIDKYIGYMLRELKTCVTNLVVICNEIEVVMGRDIIERYADEIFYRENIGFDAGGFKDALCRFLGWKEVFQYDELILVNDSMFGPFKPMEDIFDEMDEKQVDFWGLIKHGECRNNDMGYIPEHIQSFFIVIRSRMLRCPQFREYWESMPYFDTFYNTVMQHEIKFTQYFSELGYTYATLADTEINDSKNIFNNYIQYHTIPYELIKKRNFPFLKKKQLMLDDILAYQTQENIRLAIDYINKFTNYDVDLIWDNIIRTLNVADLQKSFRLQYIISSEKRKQIYDRVAILIFVMYPESIEYILEYIQDIYNIYHIEIFVQEKEYLDFCENLRYKYRITRISEFGNVLSEFCDYDFVCVLHDSDMSSDHKRSCIGKSYFYNIWENLLKNNNHILGVIEQFKNEPRLGFLAPPPPIFEQYFGEFGNDWNEMYEKVYDLLKNLTLKCNFSKSKPPFNVTNNFWIRGCILKELKNISTCEYGSLSYIWSYLAQGAGYYSGVIESLEYAAMNEVNLQYYLKKIVSHIYQQYGQFKDFFQLEEQIQIGALYKYCGSYSKICVYGAGDLAQKYMKMLKNIEVFIVTDGKEKKDFLEGIPVKYLSEVKISGDCGIVLCLNKENQEQVKPLLEKMGISHYFPV